MEIKCPVCGKKYRYDSKICQECEDYSISSGLTDFRGRDNHKWNCSIFLDIDTIAFKTSKICELIKDLTPEPNNLAIHKREFYNWNCESINRFDENKESFRKPLTLQDVSTFMRTKNDSSLIYE